MLVRECRIDILTRDNGLLLPSSTGLPVPIQATRAVATLGEDSQSHVVVRAAADPWLPPRDRNLASLFPVYVITTILADGPGVATVTCSGSDDLTRLMAASVVATVKRSWGWDESQSIAVRFSSGESVVLNPVFSDGVWRTQYDDPP